ncbi:MAG: hypothetical protein SPL83_02540 [Succinivibrio sp.]|nr:hypothetical protein [Succinivibrio sp.]
MLYTTRRAASTALDKSLLNSVSPKKKNVFEMIGSGVSTTLNIISNTAKTIENCSEMMYQATTQMNKAMYNKLSPEAKAEFDARMAELHIDVSKYKNK